MRQTKQILGVAILLALGGANAALAANYYIDKSHPQAGDSNPGTAEKPWATMYKLTTAPLKPGDIVYVKPGRYDVSLGGNWDRPAINLAASGTKEAPITIRALPRHGAILDAAGKNPGIGSRARHYITIDGFVMDNCGTKGIAVFGSGTSSKVRGVVLQNNIVHRVHNSITDNTDGLRLEDVADIVVRNNLIYDVHNATMDANAAGIKIYRSENGLFENNEIYDVATGIIDKQAGINNVFRRNYIHDCVGVGLYLKTGPGNPARGLRAYQNIVNKCSKGALVEENGDGTIITDVHVYNNVFANYREAGMNPNRFPTNKVSIWNNIFYRASTVTPSAGDFYTYTDPASSVALMDYNLYVSNPKFLLGRYKTNRTFSSVSAWSAATGFDSHALSTNAGFVDVAQSNFRLAAGSPALGAGRSNGRTDGQPVNMGAYLTGNEVIGLLPISEAPKAPQLLTVE